MTQRHSRILLFVVNTPEFFLSHRLPIAIAAHKAGYEVHVASAEGDGVQAVLAHGFVHHSIGFARSGQNPWVEFRTLVSLVQVMRRVQPDIVHLITIKPVLYGGIAARLVRVPAVVSAVSGLGTVFLAHTWATRLRRWFIIELYKAAFKQRSLAVIFQNPDDRDTLISSGAIQSGDTRMIRGSGVSLDDYPCVTEPEGKPVAVMAARLLRNKGVVEFVGAARILRDRGVDVDMRLIGSPDLDNPASVTELELERWKSESVVTLMGYRKDIAHQYASSNIVCLPSYYGEGLPKSLVEAAACGRAVVTTDHPGCRDAILPDETGVLIPIKDSVALANAIQRLIENPDLRRKMGKAGRELAEEAFSIDQIVEQHLKIYDEVMATVRNGSLRQ
ncbi:glycosyltransferase family 4 protein [Marinobacter nauticus]|uniref:Glycosyl transferase, group 1 n=1 Tax=Marinobacter nauticus (strain ATCC 700491 / DSM 11845 / VT8) TaxID=351348 RepID=A1U3X0_MARN8|nr:glycosyltransferase family 4 protein [Marinobacter nauticus]ABM19689.1 glycosyl transferase, group 1 [Marinobacter nauticus VT8]